MTLRQVAGLLKVINRSDLVEFYNRSLSYRLSQAHDFPSLEEILAPSSNKTPTSFDAATDTALEIAALKRLEEKRLKHGK